MVAEFHSCPRCRTSIIRRAAVHLSVGFANHFALCQTSVFIVVLRSDFRGDRSGNALAYLKLRHSPTFRESLAVASAGTYIAALGCIRSAFSLPHSCVSVPSHLQPLRVRSDRRRALRQGGSRRFSCLVPFALNFRRTLQAEPFFLSQR